MGTKKPRHNDPLLLPEQVEEIRLARAVKTPFKVLARTYGCSRRTLYRAAHGHGPYADYAGTSTTRIQALIDDAARWRAHVAVQAELEMQHEAR